MQGDSLARLSQRACRIGSAKARLRAEGPSWPTPWHGWPGKTALDGATKLGRRSQTERGKFKRTLALKWPRPRVSEPPDHEFALPTL